MSEHNEQGRSWPGVRGPGPPPGTIRWTPEVRTNPMRKLYPRARTPRGELTTLPQTL